MNTIYGSTLSVTAITPACERFPERECLSARSGPRSWKLRSHSGNHGVAVCSAAASKPRQPAADRLRSAHPAARSLAPLRAPAAALRLRAGIRRRARGALG